MEEMIVTGRVRYQPKAKGLSTAVSVRRWGTAQGGPLTYLASTMDLWFRGSITAHVLYFSKRAG